MASDNLRNNLNMVISMIILLIIASIIGIWVYNFMAQSDGKLFDDNNKYIDPTLTNPDIESNYKDTYKHKMDLDGIILSMMNFFGTLKGVIVIIFMAVLLLGLILKNRKSVIEHIKGMF